MKPDEKDPEMKDTLELTLGRPAKPNEIANMETDALLLAQYLKQCTGTLERRIAVLESKVK